MIPHAAVAFLGSFLLFQLELIAARLLLPGFGGSAYVWTTSVSVFSGLLLAGTLYARAALRRFGASYPRAHLFILALPILFLPVRVLPSAAHGRPILELTSALARAVALPFFVLSTTMPVVQSWLKAREDSYRLYAASNSGALTALLSYPFFVEPFFPLDGQLRFWSLAYCLYAVLHLFCLPQANAAIVETAAQRRSTPREVFSWLAFSAGPCAAMLAAANFISFHFAAVPLFWVVPLALYLSTFILNFKREPFVPRLWVWALVLLSGYFLVPPAISVLFGRSGAGETAVLAGLFFNLAILFTTGMVCHRQLALSVPAPGDAPSFYGAIAAGGWCGTLLIGLAVPCLGRYGANLAIDWAIAFLLCASGWIAKDILSRNSWHGVPNHLAIGSGRPGLLPRMRDVAYGRAWTLGAGILMGAAAAFSLARGPASGTLFAWRGFYGVYRVEQNALLRRFIHGNTVHGLQYRGKGLETVPLGYFHEKSPVGRVLKSYGSKFKTVGVVGLGAGTLAAYGRPGQELDFYELDPKVSEIARGYFSYLGASRAAINVLEGDARLALQDSTRSYDLLILDAFSSDSIPVHLITREAFEIYLKRLKPGGLILCNISNRLLDLTPVLAGVAKSLGLSAWESSFVRSASSREGAEFFDSRWTALSPDLAWAAKLRSADWEDIAGTPLARAWTDQHASLLMALRPGKVFGP